MANQVNADPQQAFICCPHCGSWSLGICPACKHVDNYAYQPQALTCGCGATWSSLKCPHCKADVPTSSIYSETTDDGLRSWASRYKPPRNWSKYYHLYAVVIISLFVIGAGVNYVRKCSNSSGSAEQQLRARVDCIPRSKGFDCSVKHIQGKASAKVCWSLFLTCKSGTTVQLNACASVEPEGVVTQQMTHRNLVSGQYLCASVVSSRLKVTSVTAE